MKILRMISFSLALALALSLSPARAGEDESIVAVTEAPDPSSVTEIYEDLGEAEEDYGMEVYEPEKFVIPQGTIMEEETDVTFDPKDVVEITTDDAVGFISEKFLFWAYERLDQRVMASIAYDSKHIGDSGRFYVPDLGVDVAIYYANEMNAPFAQQIVDEEDAGVYTPHIGGQAYLADHSSQAFAGLHHCREGLMGFWKHVDRIDVFYCTRTCNGTNDGLYIYDDKEENCFFMNEGGFFTYTCNEDWQHVSIAFWQPVGTLWL